MDYLANGKWQMALVWRGTKFKGLGVLKWVGAGGWVAPGLQHKRGGWVWPGEKGPHPRDSEEIMVAMN